MKASEALRIGDIIRWKRERMGWTQKKLAEESGIHEVQIRRYENNKSLPRDAQLSKIAEAFGLEKDYFEDIPQRKAEMNAAYFRTPDGRPVHGKVTAPRTTPPDGFKGSMIYLDEVRRIVKGENARYSPTIHVDDVDWKLNEIIQKKRRNEELTQEEQQQFNTYLQTFNERWELAKERMNGHLKRLQAVFEQLNESGQEKADEQIDRLIEQLELLTKIPEYQKDYETKTAAPEREPQDGETDTQ
ncbi:MAG: helix-turn-helix domain-containing protein [Lachnospiraceae bacterium]